MGLKAKYLRFAVALCLWLLVFSVAVWADDGNIAQNDAAAVSEVAETANGGAEIAGGESYATVSQGNAKSNIPVGFTGIAKNKETGTWDYFKNGAPYKGYTGVAISSYDQKKYYVVGGTVDFTFTGLAYDREAGDWQYFYRGKENSTFKGIAVSAYDGNNYFVRNGKWDRTFTGFSWNPMTRTWDYTKNGKANYNFKGVAKSIYDGQYYYGYEGRVDFGFTGLGYSQDHKGYIYVRRGKYYPDYSGPAYSMSTDMVYHVWKGKWAKAYSGKYKWKGSTYTVVRGRIVNSTIYIEGTMRYVASNSRVQGDRVINGRRYLYDENGNLASNTGIDVSGFNGDIDWNAVKKNGIDYAMVRVGGRYAYSGEIYSDDTATTNLANANKSGVPVGTYFFTQAINVKEAVEEAAFTVNMIKDYKIDYPVAIDSEWFSGSNGAGRHESISVTKRTQVIKAYCDYIKKAGYTPMIYGSTYWFRDYLDMSKLQDYMVWCAQYADSCEYTGPYRAWQYTSTGKVKGISGDVDMNIWYK